MSTEKPALTKFETCLFKSDDISYEDFKKYILEDYAPKAAPVMKKYGMVQWSTTFNHPEYREPHKQLMKQMGRDDWTVAEYDVTMSYWVRSLDDLMTLVASPEWAELEADAGPRVNLRIGHIAVGHQKIQFGSEEAGR